MRREYLLNVIREELEAVLDEKKKRKKKKRKKKKGKKAKRGKKR